MFQKFLRPKYLIWAFILITALICYLYPTIQKYSRTVSLDWSSGEIVFASDRVSPGRNLEGWDGLLYFLNTSNFKYARIQNTYSQAHFRIAPTWSPDGKILSYVKVLSESDVPDNPEAAGRAATIFVDTEGTTRVFGVRCFAVTWSPDGSEVAYYHLGDDGVSLRISNPDRTNERVLVSDLPAGLSRSSYRVEDVRITWSSNGWYIAFDSLDETGNEEIWFLSVQDGTVRPLVSGSHPDWSLLRNEIVFDRDGDIWIVSFDDGTETLIIGPPGKQWLYDGWPIWSPDGRQLAFVGSSEGNAEIYRIDRDGMNLTNMTNHSSYDAFPAWKPVANESAR